MEDLFVNFIGAVVFSVIGFFYVKGRGKSRIAPRFIPQVMNTPAGENEGGGSAPKSGAKSEKKE